jgi:hypothetical protein
MDQKISKNKHKGHGKESKKIKSPNGGYKLEINYG